VGFKEPTWQAYETLPPVVIEEYRKSLEEAKEKYEEVPPYPLAPEPSSFSSPFPLSVHTHKNTITLMTNTKIHTHTQNTL
jgi:hypothetical protein